MIGVIIISESKAAAEMLKSVEHVLGKRKVKGMFPLVIKSNFEKRTLKAKINALIKKINADSGVVIMSEIFGSTQTNVCLDFLDKNSIELICGYNLPMLIKAATINGSTNLAKFAKEVSHAGQKYIKTYG